jgi:FlaA1/EpsC-like NDP-sugar epimerase
MTETARDRSSRTTLLGEQTVEPSGVLKRYRKFSYLIALTDGLSIVTAMLTAYVLRFGFAPVPTDFILLITSAPIVLVGIFSAFRLYSVQLIGPAEEFRRVIAGVSTTIAAIAFFGFWSHIPYSRLWLGVTWIVTPLLCLVSRRGWRRAMWRMRATGDLAYRTLIVGANEEATRALKAFRSPALGFQPVAIASTEMGNGQRPSTLDVSLITIGTEVVGNIEDLRRVIRQLAVNCVFVASSAVSPDLMAVEGAA